MGVMPPGGISSNYGLGGPNDAQFRTDFLNYLSNASNFDPNAAHLAADIDAYLTAHPEITDPTQIENVVQEFLNHTLTGPSGQYPDAKSVYMQYELSGVTTDPKGAKVPGTLDKFMEELTNFAKGENPPQTWSLTEPEYTTLDQDFMITVDWLTDPGKGLPPTTIPLAQQVQQLLISLGPGDSTTALVQGEAQIIFSKNLFAECPGLKLADYQVFLGSGFLHGDENFIPYIFNAAGTGPSALWSWISAPPAGASNLVNSLLTEMQNLWAGSPGPNIVTKLNTWISTQISSPNFFVDNPGLQWADFQTFYTSFGNTAPAILEDYFNTGMFLADNHGTENGRVRMAEVLFTQMQTDLAAGTGTEASLQTFMRNWLANPANVFNGGSEFLQSGDVGTVLGFIHDSIPYADTYVSACFNFYSSQQSTDNAPLYQLVLNSFTHEITIAGSTLADVQNNFNTWFNNPANYGPLMKLCWQCHDYEGALGEVGESADAGMIGQFLELTHKLYNSDGSPSGAYDTQTMAVLNGQILPWMAANFLTKTGAELTSWFNSYLTNPSLGFFNTYAGVNVTTVNNDLTQLLTLLGVISPGFPAPDYQATLVNAGMWLAANTSPSASHNAVSMLFTEMGSLWPTPTGASQLITWMKNELNGATSGFFQAVFGASGPVTQAPLDELATLLGQSTSMDGLIATIAQDAIFAHGGDVDYKVLGDLLAEAAAQWPSGTAASLHTWVINTITSPTFFTTYVGKLGWPAIQQLYVDLGYPSPDSEFLEDFYQTGTFLQQYPSNKLYQGLLAEMNSLITSSNPPKISDLQSWAWTQITSPAFYTTYYGVGSTLTETDFNRFITNTSMGYAYSSPYNFDTTFQHDLFIAGIGYIGSSAADLAMNRDLITQMAAAWQNQVSSGTAWKQDLITNWIEKDVMGWGDTAHVPFSYYATCTQAGVEAIENLFGVTIPPMQSMMFSLRAMMAKDTTTADQTMFLNLYNDILKADWTNATPPPLTKVVADFNAFFATQDVAMQNWQVAGDADHGAGAWQDVFNIIYTGTGTPPIFTATANDTDYISMMNYLQTAGLPTADTQLFQMLKTDMFTLGSTSTNYTQINTDLQNYLWNLQGTLLPATITKLLSYSFIESSTRVPIVYAELAQYGNQPGATSGMKGFAVAFQNLLNNYSGTPDLQTYLEPFFEDDACFVFKGVSPTDVQGFWATLGVNQVGSLDPNYYVFTQLDTNYATFCQDYHLVRNAFPDPNNVNDQAMETIDQIFENIHNGVAGWSWSNVTSEIATILKTWTGLDPATVGYLQAIAAMPPYVPSST